MCVRTVERRPRAWALICRCAIADDGFGIAWAVAEHLVTQTKCLTLFATHFHELTALEQGQAVVASGQADGCDHSLVSNRHVSAHTTGTPPRALSCAGHCCLTCCWCWWLADDSITMLYEVKPGPSHNSFGLHAAKLAQMPPALMEDARRSFAALKSGASLSTLHTPAAPTKRSRSDAELQSGSGSGNGSGSGSGSGSGAVGRPPKRGRVVVEVAEESTATA